MFISRTNSPRPYPLPLKDEGSDEGANDDAYDDVPIIVHSQEHDPVGRGELERVQERAGGLLRDAGAEGDRRRHPQDRHEVVLVLVLMFLRYERPRSS